MSKLCNIPMKYKNGIYGFSDFKQNTEYGIEFNYEEYGEIVRYQVPDYEDSNEVVFYGIKRDELKKTMQVFYDETGHLNRITIQDKNKEKLLYIHYYNTEDAKEKIRNFALKNVEKIIETICQCKEVVSRLFLEYFNDGQYLDFHAKVGTEKQKIALEEKYPQYDDIADSCGDYPSDIIEGDNDELKVYILCADDNKMDFFQFAVDIMKEEIREKAVEQLNKSDDFKFMCDEYD